VSSRRRVSKPAEARPSRSIPWHNIASWIAALAGVVACLEGVVHLTSSTRSKPRLTLTYDATHTTSLVLLQPQSSDVVPDVRLPITLEARNNGGKSAEGVELHLGFPVDMDLMERPTRATVRSIATARGESLDVSFACETLDPRKPWSLETLQCRVYSPLLPQHKEHLTGTIGIDPGRLVYAPSQVPGFSTRTRLLMGQFYARDYDQPPVKLAVIWASRFQAQFARVPLYAISQDSSGRPLLELVSDFTNQSGR
jgi:hypothetical protein